tara:strand:- start:58624 stop:60066 length:1443 start_codon:yes stop_codon:yes gene_type:complete
MRKNHIILTVFFLTTFICFGQWAQIGSDIDGEAASDVSGGSVSLSGDGSIVAIGASDNDGNGIFSGHVRVYKNDTGVWTQIGEDIDGENQIDFSGMFVSLSNDGAIVAIGAIGNDGNGNNSGHVRVYENDNGTWIQIGSDIDGEASSDGSGRVSLSNDGTIVAIGATGNDGNGNASGHVRVYENNNGVWDQIGIDINGEAADDLSGHSVSLNSDGKIVAIGASGNDGNGLFSGHVRVYENDNGTWTQIGSDIDGEVFGDASGSSVSLNDDGTIVAIGAMTNHGNGSDSGHARIYENENGIWTQIGADIDGETSGDKSGHVSLNGGGNVVAIGATSNDDNGMNTGHVRVYQIINGTWSRIGADIDGEAVGDGAGRVSLSDDGSLVAIGAIGNNGNGQDSGHVRIYENQQIVLSNTHIKIADIDVKIKVIAKKIVLNSKEYAIAIYNMFGQTIKNENLAPGVYIVKITAREGNYKTTKIIIE